MKKLIVVGAGSSVGKQVQVQLAGKFDITGIKRRPDSENDNSIIVSDYKDIPSEHFFGADAVLNCVGSSRPKNLKNLLIVNKEIPLSIATAAKRAGAKHFIHISSVKVYGHQEKIDNRTIEAPVSNYAQTKLFGDLALKEIQEDGFGVAIVRPPALYGFGTGANFVRIAKFMSKIRFLVAPTDTVQRSILHLPNLVSALEKIIDQEKTGVFLVADKALMTLQMIAESVSEASHSQVRIFEIPRFWLSPLRILASEVYFSIFHSQEVESTSGFEPCSGTNDREELEFSKFIHDTISA